MMTGYLTPLGFIALAVVAFGAMGWAIYAVVQAENRRDMRDTARARLSIVPQTTDLMDDEDEEPGYDTLAAVRDGKESEAT